MNRTRLIPIPHQSELTIYGKEVLGIALHVEDGANATARPMPADAPVMTTLPWKGCCRRRPMKSALTSTAALGQCCVGLVAQRAKAVR
jgi:hypothetical protein